MKILFWLYRSHKNSKGLMPLMMRITCKERINLPTQINIEEKAWDTERQQIKGNSDLVKKYNRHLLTLRTKAWDFYNDCIRHNKQFSARDIRQYILGNNAPQHSIIEALDYQINHLKARSGIDIAPSTVKKYETCKRKVIDFLKERDQNDMSLNKINFQFINELDLFMRVKQGLHNNGVAKNMQQLHTVLRAAIMNEWLDKDPFAKYQCKIIEPKRVYLTKEELQKLEEQPLTCDRLNKVRDVFVFSCYTGLAYADVSKLCKDHIHEINGLSWIILDRTKTKNQSTIPIFPRAMEIIKRYEMEKLVHLLPIIASQNLNKYIKEVAEIAGIKKRLSFHAARHTFATTVTLNNGVDITSVSAMLGHRMLKTTQIYAKVNVNKIAADTEHLTNIKGGK